MIYDTTAQPLVTRRSFLDRRFAVDRRSAEILLYVLLFVLSVGLHLWQLDRKAMHHDESIHAWMSYKFFTGSGDFECAGNKPDAGVVRQATTYCYNPVYHGPSLYVLTALMYFLFGDGEAQARLPEALAGIALVPMAWSLRSFIGRRGAFLAAVLLTISPSILYYTRFARHDGLVLLWSMFMVVGMFKWVRDGGAASLALAAAGLALTWATHELVFILIFIGGSFLGLRALWEWRPRVFAITCGVVIAAAVLVVIAALSLSPTAQPVWHSRLERVLGPALMLGLGALLALPMARGWERGSVVYDRVVDTWRGARREYWVAAAAFLVVFTLLFTTFFAYPRGFLDGWYQGINYWLGSQHEFARGGQPWFYYLMLLPIYDLLALVFGLVGLGWLVGRGLRRQPAAGAVGATPAGGSDGNGNGAEPHRAAAAQVMPQPPLFVFFLGYWFVESLVAFSWAGEKMPWLLTHISLPATLLAAWTLGQLARRVPWRELREDYGWAVPLLTLVMALSVVVAAYAFGGGDQTVAGLRARLQGIIPILVAGACLFGLLTIGSWFGGRVVLRLAGLTIAALLALYGIRAATQVVYRTPDVPIDPLIYTQTAPDVPILVRQIEALSINATRNDRSADDPTGGLSMPVVIDNDLAWPMQWYLRHFKPGSARWVDATNNPTIDPQTGMVVLYTPHVTTALQEQLDADFVKTSEGVFNWWFPEYTGAGASADGTPPARGYKSLAAEGTTPAARVWSVVSWPLRPANWRTLTSYMVYRTLPLEIDGRDMVVYVRRDLAPGGGTAATQVPTETVATSALVADGQLSNPRGMTLDADGNLYIADAGNHRIVVVGPNGAQLRTIGKLGNGDGELNEPSGVAVDAAGNVYVADTWNGRVVKFGPDGAFVKSWGQGETQFGEPFTDPATGKAVQRLATDNRGDPAANAAKPLGFFGPRNVLVSGDRLYIADTGNTRVVVTDLDGNFLQQIGSKGNAAGQLQEPIGLGVDAQNRLYVGDTWNARIQIFQIAAESGLDATPTGSFNVSGWAANTYNDPYIAVAPDGQVWASQGGRDTIAQFDIAHEYVRRLKGEPGFQAPKGLALSPAGDLYVANSRQGAVVAVRTP